MSRGIVFCEGRRDVVFFEEYIQNYLSMSARAIDTYEVARLARYPGDDVLLLDCGGVPAIYDVAIRLTRQLIGEKTLPYLIMIGDSDRVKLQKLGSALEDYLSRPSKQHNIRTKVEVRPEEGVVLLSGLRIGVGEKLIRLLTIPGNLESQIAKKIKLKYRLKPRSNPEITIREAATNYFSGNENQLIKESVSWLAGEPWLKRMGEMFLRIK